MSGLEINTKKLGEIYKEWRGNESCYDNGRPVFEADELLDFAQFCLKHEANVFSTGEGQPNIPDVVGRSEQLKAFADYAQKRMWEDGDKDLSEFVDEFLRL